MSHGLRIWDASGKLSLDITDRFPKIFAYYYVTLESYGGMVLSVPGYIPGDFLIDSEFKVSEETEGSFRVSSFINSPRSGNVFIYKG